LNGSIEPTPAAQLYEAKLAELRAFEASPPAGWNYVGSPVWQLWMRLKEEVVAAETEYFTHLALQVQKQPNT
jgi:hypothetical protein